MKKFIIPLLIYFAFYFVSKSLQDTKDESTVYFDNLKILTAEHPVKIQENILKDIPLSKPEGKANGKEFKHKLKKYFFKRKYKWKEKNKKLTSSWYISKYWLTKATQEMKKIKKVVNLAFFKQYKKNKKKFNNPKYSYNYFWNFAYNYVAAKNSIRLNNIIRAFRYFKKQNKLSKKQLAKIVIHFVQSIKYKIPKDDPLGFLSPLQMLKRRNGDCDTRALFMIMVLKKLGYRTVMFHSRFYKHAMVGLSLKARGKYKKYKGRKFYFVETTAKGWNIGMLSKKNRNIKKWNVFEIKI